jgi:beta-phosphoglucomutase-like phosphatase (HAD superfamily)
MVKAVIFDIDGTLIDSVDLHARAWQETFSRYGVKTNFRAVRDQIGKGGDKLMKVFLSEQQIDRWGKEIAEERTALFKRQYLPQVKPFPHLRGLFERLRKDKIEIALASSAKDDEIRAYKKITGIGPYLHAEISSDDVAHSKPDADIFWQRGGSWESNPGTSSPSAIRPMMPSLPPRRVWLPSACFVAAPPPRNYGRQDVWHCTGTRRIC